MVNGKEISRDNDIYMHNSFCYCCLRNKKKHIKNSKNTKNLKENELEDDFDEFTDQFII